MVALDNTGNTMSNGRNNNTILSLTIGAIVASCFVVMVTILGELLPSFKELLRDLHHHHWVGKGIWTLAVFAVSSIVSWFSVRNKDIELSQIAAVVTLLTWVVIFGAAILLLFFGYEYTLSH